jgi:hypothetical protein
MLRSPSSFHVVYLDRQPFACCTDRAEALQIAKGLLSTRHAKRVHLLRA